MPEVAELTVAQYGNEVNILVIKEDGIVKKTIKWGCGSITAVGDRVIGYLQVEGIPTVKVMNGGIGWAVEDYLKDKGVINARGRDKAEV